MIQKFPVIISRADIERAYKALQTSNAEFAEFNEFDFGGEMGERIAKMKKMIADAPKPNKEILEKMVAKAREECEQFGIEFNEKDYGETFTKLNARKRYGPNYENMLLKGPKQEKK